MGYSLKVLIPTLAKAVDMTPAAIYERQRALVRAGLLDREPGRGPGSGVRASPESVALLLIALLATGSLTETESQTKSFAQLKSMTKRCPLTGERTFGTALAAILASEEYATRVCWMEVERGGLKAESKIVFRAANERIDADRKKFATSAFGFPGANRESRLSVRATLELPLHAIARRLGEA